MSADVQYGHPRLKEALYKGALSRLKSTAEQCCSNKVVSCQPTRTKWQADRHGVPRKQLEPAIQGCSCLFTPRLLQESLETGLAARRQRSVRRVHSMES